MLAGPDGRFGARGVTIKSAGLGAGLLVEGLLGRKYPRARKWFAIVNFSVAGALSAAAAHNYGSR